jgi:hypothetical protein
LICHLCKEKRGCCFQCSEKKCHSAFHITCAFKNNLEMQTTLGHRQDDIVFKVFSSNHLLIQLFNFNILIQGLLFKT